ncbi:hypothetical protein [Paenibacillus sp. CF384]|uniref:hypothetical protein n=1 Tax=Paenibacillus sp. CF384 TaxID=1884382 RepID=UPI0008987CFC|nr:hypothetical protein [Paenibacillus sp. CF384]SDX81762.1 hypothetical protein SAMN05518855_10238 [Paenibacillus sp. CF384]
MKFSITKCTELAHEARGEVGECILSLIDEIRILREQVAASPSYPKLVGSAEVSEILGIDRRNMHHKRKTKGFPDPVLVIKSGPLWIEDAIIEFRDESDDRRRKDEDK